MVSNRIALIALLGPYLAALGMVGNCWAHGKTRASCDPGGQVPDLIQSVTTAAFAWLATPPR